MTITTTDTPAPATDRAQPSGSAKTSHRSSTASEPSAGEVVLAALRKQTKTLRKAEPKVRDNEPKAVTQMRVATRQLRSTLRGFSRILDPSATRPLNAELAWLGRQLGEENDTHATIKELRRQYEALPEELIVGPVVNEARRELDQLVAHATHATQATLDSPRYTALLHTLDQLLADPPLTERAARPASQELPKSVAKALRRLDCRLASAQAQPAGPPRDQALHEARKADKQLRHVTEIAAPVIGKPARRLARQAKELQALLGEYQDAVVTRPIVHQLAAAAAADGRPVSTYYLVDALEQVRTDRALQALPKRLNNLHRKAAWLPTTNHQDHQRPQQETDADTSQPVPAGPRR
jgi:CHAD domain-containing protein